MRLLRLEHGGRLWLNWSIASVTHTSRIMVAGHFCKSTKKRQYYVLLASIKALKYLLRLLLMMPFYVKRNIDKDREVKIEKSIFLGICREFGDSSIIHRMFPIFIFFFIRL